MNVFTDSLCLADTATSWSPTACSAPAAPHRLTVPRTWITAVEEMVGFRNDLGHSWGLERAHRSRRTMSFYYLRVNVYLKNLSARGECPHFIFYICAALQNCRRFYIPARLLPTTSWASSRSAVTTALRSEQHYYFVYNQQQCHNHNIDLYRLRNGRRATNSLLPAMHTCRNSSATIGLLWTPPENLCASLDPSSCGSTLAWTILSKTGHDRVRFALIAGLRGLYEGVAA